MTPPFADAFLAGAILSTVLPIALLIAMAWWYVHAVRGLPARKNGNGASATPARGDQEPAGASGDQPPEAH